MLNFSVRMGTGVSNMVAPMAVVLDFVNYRQNSCRLLLNFVQNRWRVEERLQALCAKYKKALGFVYFIHFDSCKMNKISDRFHESLQ